MLADPLETDTALDEVDADPDSDRLSEVHKRAMERFDYAMLATQECREQSLLARRFVAIPGAQWEGEWGEQWENSIKLEVNKVGRGLRKIETDYRENRIVPDFRPDGPRADQTTADMLDGLHRADSYRFKSQQARDNAAFEAFAGGFGAYRLTNEWEDESDRDNDYQRINPASIIVDADQSVFFDVDARLYDKSDARYAFVRVGMSPAAYETRFGERPDTEFPQGTSWKVKDWYQPDMTAVAEYYEREEVSDTLWIMTHTLSGEEKRLWSSELGEGQLAEMTKDGYQRRKQSRRRWRVHKYIIDGARVIEDRGLIAGDAIPIVPIYGQRYFVDGFERWKGYVQDKIDPQRLYNSNVSKLAETNSLAQRELPIFAPEQMPPWIGDQWARANIDRLPYLLAEPLRDAQGEIVAQGPIAKLTPPTLAPVTATLIQIANADLQEDMDDGADEVKANTSAEAMDVAATRVDARSGPYLDNVRQSTQREGEIYVGIASEVYADEDREVETMTEDGDDGRAILKQAVTDPKTGKHSTINDLQYGRYKVIASVTEATATRRDKTVRSMLSTAQIAAEGGDAELAQVCVLTATMNQDGEGISDVQNYARKRLVTMGVVEPNEEEQAEMEKAAQNAQPDPLADLAGAQADEARANAALKAAQVDKTKADTGLSKAKTVDTLANARATATTPNVVPMRGSAERPMIRRGSELAA